MIQSDVDVIKRARRGDPLAWEQLVKQYVGRIFNLCYRFVGKSDQAEVLTQEAFIRVFKVLSTTRTEQGSLVAFVVSITRNLLIDHYRKTRDEPNAALTGVIENGDGGTLEAPLSLQTQTNPNGEPVRKERVALFHWALQRLSPELREAIILRDLEEFSYEEMAAILNVPDGTVKTRINRGRLELAKSLRRYRMRSPNAFA